jgi:hypothetical protein
MAERTAEQPEIWISSMASARRVSANGTHSPTAGSAGVAGSFPDPVAAARSALTSADQPLPFLRPSRYWRRRARPGSSRSPPPRRTKRGALPWLSKPAISWRQASSPVPAQSVTRPAWRARANTAPPWTEPSRVTSRTSPGGSTMVFRKRSTSGTAPSASPCLSQRTVPVRTPPSARCTVTPSSTPAGAGSCISWPPSLAKERWNVFGVSAGRQ